MHLVHAAQVVCSYVISPGDGLPGYDRVGLSKAAALRGRLSISQCSEILGIVDQTVLHNFGRTNAGYISRVPHNSQTFSLYYGVSPLRVENFFLAS